MVVLLMKRWGITLNPAYASSEADNVFQQTKSAGAALQREFPLMLPYLPSHRLIIVNHITLLCSSGTDNNWHIKTSGTAICTTEPQYRDLDDLGRLRIYQSGALRLVRR